MIPFHCKRQQEKARPALADYFDGMVAERAKAHGEGLLQQKIASLDPILLRQVLAAELAGQPLTPGAYEMLRRLAEKRSMNSETYASLILANLFSIR